MSFGRNFSTSRFDYVTFPSSCFSAFSHERPLLEGSRQGAKVHVRAFVLGVWGLCARVFGSFEFDPRSPAAETARGRTRDGTHELLPNILPPSLPRTLPSTQGLPQSSCRCFQTLECFPLLSPQHPPSPFCSFLLARAISCLAPLPLSPAPPHRLSTTLPQSSSPRSASPSTSPSSGLLVLPRIPTDDLDGLARSNFRVGRFEGSSR